MPTSKLIIRNIGNVKIIIPPTYKLVKVLKAIRFSLVALQLKLDARFLQFFDFKEMLFILYLADVLREVIDTIKPNLIHVHSLFNPFNLALRIVNPSIPIIITDHGAYWQVRKQRKGLLKLGLALSIPSLRKVICVSKHVREKLLRFHTVLSKYFPTLISPDNIVVIHNPIDTTRFPTLDPEKLKELKRKIGGDKKIVMFCAVTEPIRRKRLDLLLKAFTANDYLRNSCRLIIVSNEEGVSYARRFASQNKLDLIALSKVPWKELVEYYAIADVLAVPSYAEPFGLVYTEALSLGIPIVGSYESIKELEELLGIYIGEKFDPRHEDERKLAEKIVRVLNSSIDRELLRRRIREKLSWEAKFKEYDSIYKEVLFNDMDTKVFNR